MRSSVKPGKAATHLLHLQRTVVQVATVEVRNLQFASRRGLELRGEIAGATIVEVQSSDGVARFWLGRLFLETYHLAGGVELGDTVALRVLDPVAEHASAMVATGGALQQIGQATAVENVVAE